MTTKEEKAHMDAVAQIGCIACINLGYISPYECPPGVTGIHHTGTHMGGGRDHMKVLPLCHPHHQGPGGIDGKKMSAPEWECVHGTEEVLLKQIEEILLCH